jgi:hypothetical protein
MRCPRCGNEVDMTLMECDRCGLATPKSKDSKGEEKSNTGSLKGNTGKLTGNLNQKKFSWLPKFLENSPLNKIKIPIPLVVILVLFIPAAAVGYYFYAVGVCIKCVEVGGTYSTEITIDEKPINLDLAIFQDGNNISGQVQFSTKGDPTAKPPVKKELYVQYIDTTSLSEKGFSFKTKLKSNGEQVEFSGSVENNTIIGNLLVNIPELNCNNKTFPITIKKS